MKVSNEESKQYHQSPVTNHISIAMVRIPPLENPKTMRHILKKKCDHPHSYQGSGYSILRCFC